MASKIEICSPDRRYEHSRFKIYNDPYICKHTFTALSDMYTFVIVMVEIKQLPLNRTFYNNQWLANAPVNFDMIREARKLQDFVEAET